MKGSKNMSWVNLDDVYVNKTGDTIAGDLSVGGALTINDGKGTDTTYNVANEITTLRDSVSHTGFTCLKGSIESGTYCAYTRIGHLICVFMNDMPSLGTKGVLPEGYRPPTDIIGFGYVRGTNTSGQILVNSAGEVSTWCNQNNSHYFSGSVCFVVE